MNSSVSSIVNDAIHASTHISNEQKFARDTLHKGKDG